MRAYITETKEYKEIRYNRHYFDFNYKKAKVQENCPIFSILEFYNAREKFKSSEYLQACECAQADFDLWATFFENQEKLDKKMVELLSKHDARKVSDFMAQLAKNTGDPVADQSNLFAAFEKFEQEAA